MIFSHPRPILRSFEIAAWILFGTYCGTNAALTRVSLPPQQQEKVIDIMESHDPKLEALKGIEYYARERVDDLKSHGLNTPDDQIDLERWSRILRVLEKSED